MTLLVTKERIEERISSYKDSIKRREDEIAELRSKIEEQVVLKKKIELYEARPISERTLEKRIYSDTETIPIFTEFEELNEDGFRKYERLLFANAWMGCGCDYQLIIERLGNREAVGDITMTEFKKSQTYRLRQHIEEQINRYRANHTLEDGSDIMFDPPFHLRAQNSGNRTGYGNRYEGEFLVYEGTPYGETTDYAFVGVHVKSVYGR